MFAVNEPSRAYSIEVTLGERIYNPGDLIQGRIHLSLNRKLFCDTILVQLYGAVKVFWTATTQDDQGTFQRIPYAQKEVLVNEKSVVWSAENKPKTLPKTLSLDDIVRYSSSTAIRLKKLERGAEDCGLDPGTHDFHFTMQLPKRGLYTSFEQLDCCACVRYFIMVQCLSNEQLIAKRKLLFPVVSPVDLIEYPIASDAENIHRRVEFGRGNHLNAELHLSKKGFIPGERIPVGILIENQSGKSVKHAHLSIVQLASCFATYPSPATRDCAFETSGVGLPIPKIPTGNTYKYAPEFYVPALVPDFEILGRLKVDHFLKLEIGFNRHQKSKHAICIVKIPILIGTSTAPERPPPPSDSDAWWTKVASDSAAGKSTDGGAEGESLESGYMPNAFSRLPPPPTYLESITGRSNVQDEDDAECPAYTPLYYGHNPAFTNGIEVPSYDDKKEN